jgi:hypothetical protein
MQGRRAGRDIGVAVAAKSGLVWSSWAVSRAEGDVVTACLPKERTPVAEVCSTCGHMESGLIRFGMRKEIDKE